MELFDDAANRMLRVLNSSKAEVMQFQSLAFKANEVSIQNIKKEVDFNDAPEEFRGFTENILFCFNVQISIIEFQIH